MKPHLLETALIAAVVGAASAGLTSLLLAPEAGPAERGRGTPPLASSTAPAPTNATTAPDPELRTLLQALRDDNRTLLSRVEALENRPVPSARTPAEIAREEALPAVAARIPPSFSASPEFQDGVEAALSRIREDERAEVERLRAEREAQRTEERVARLSEELGLNPRQVGEMRSFLVQRELDKDELRGMRDTDGDREAYREARERQREEERTDLARILTPTQLEGYLARDEQRVSNDRGSRKNGNENRRGGNRDGEGRDG